MAGTLADKATLATDNAFINKCRVAIIAHAVEMRASKEAKGLEMLRCCDSQLRNAGAAAPTMAWLVAAGDPAIGAAAPEVPSDEATASAVSAFFSQL